VRKFFLLASAGALALACTDSSPDNGNDASSPADSGPSKDATAHDAGSSIDAGTNDATAADATANDATANDAGGNDAGANDATANDATANDAASHDAGDAGDAAAHDAGDAASNDSGPSDAAAEGSSDSGDASAYTGSNWMSTIAGPTSLAALSIPGTHDTGATIETSPGTLKCQNLSVPDQLTAGIRYFDIRTRNVSNKFDVYHTTLYQNLSFDTVLQNIYDFFTANPGETLIMSLKEEQPESGSTNTFEQTFDSYTAQHPERWYLDATIPTLDQVRGKIVLLRRFSVTSTPKGLDGSTGWQDNTTFTIDNGTTKLRIQDFYEFSDNNAKWTSIDNLLTEAKSGTLTTLYLNNTSGYQPLDGGVEDIPSVSNFINPKIVTYFTANTSGRYGIVAMDFADVTKSSLILSTNFH
jgi:1-phosphatidylinositol phosphodiesterase